MTKRTLGAIPTGFTAADAALGDKQERRIDHNTRLRRSGGTIELIYHSTVIARYYLRGAVELHTGGHRTVTTKARLDRIAQGAGFRLVQRRGEWELVGIHTGTCARFFEGLTLGPCATWTAKQDGPGFVAEAVVSAEPARRPLTSLLTTPPNA